MSEIAELRSKIAVAEVKVKESVYEANLDMVKKRKGDLARLEAEMAQLTGTKPSLLAELAAASTEEDVMAVLQWACDRLSSTNSLDEASAVIVELGAPKDLVEASVAALVAELKDSEPPSLADAPSHTEDQNPNPAAA